MSFDRYFRQGVNWAQVIFDIWWFLHSLFGQDTWVRTINVWADSMELGEFDHQCSYIDHIPFCGEVFNFYDDGMWFSFLMLKIAIFAIGMVWLVGAVWVMERYGSDV